ncbi:11042_t:CDS:1, partial [Ambispora leptoticha]
YHNNRASFYEPNNYSNSRANAKAALLTNQKSPLAIEVQAGTIIFMSGFVKHCSIGNASSCFRRVYMPQYSARIVYDSRLSLDQNNTGVTESEKSNGKQLLALGVPCLN